MACQRKPAKHFPQALTFRCRTVSRFSDTCFLLRWGGRAGAQALQFAQESDVFGPAPSMLRDASTASRSAILPSPLLLLSAPPKAANSGAFRAREAISIVARLRTNASKSRCSSVETESANSRSGCRSSECSGCCNNGQPRCFLHTFCSSSYCSLNRKIRTDPTPNGTEPSTDASGRFHSCLPRAGCCSVCQ